jgi:hypothetical protein
LTTTIEDKITSDTNLLEYLSEIERLNDEVQRLEQTSNQSDQVKFDDLIEKFVLSGPGHPGKEVPPKSKYEK